MVATEAHVLSRGLATLCDPVRVREKAYKYFAQIIVEASIRGYDSPINILNIYAPYKNRAPFWENLFSSDWFDIDHLLIAGDLNIALSTEECWGYGKINNEHADFIKLELLNRNMVDIVPSEMKPTWINGRVHKACIAKRIDRFLVHISILDKMGMPYSTVENILVSDHRPILLSWLEKQLRKGYSFKFDKTLLQDIAFNEYIINVWKVLKVREKPPTSQPSVKKWKRSGSLSKNGKFKKDRKTKGTYRCYNKNWTLCWD